MKKLCLLLVVFYCLIPGVVVAGELVVSVKDQAQVNSRQLTLGDIATITGEDAERVGRLQGLRLGFAPQPGNNMVLSSAELGTRLTAAKTDFSGITWKVPASINIVAASQVVSKTKLSETAIQAVRQKLALPQESFTVNLMNPVYDQVVLAGRLSLKADIPNGIRYNGVTVVKLAIYVDDNLYIQTNVNLLVKAFKTVLVAANAITVNESITAEALRLEKVDMSRLSTGFINDATKLVGLLSKRNIMPGMVLNENMFQKPIIIKRGSAVTISARVDNVEINTAGQALQDGAAGQVIRVQNIGSGKIIGGKVLDEGTVLVLEK